MKKARPRIDIIVETSFGLLQDSWNLQYFGSIAES